MVRPSRYARRFTMDTPFTVQGPAAGHPMMRTAADPAGRTVRGTLNNCASSQTPWGTYLSGEENWMGYFGHGDNRARTRSAGARARTAPTGGTSSIERFDAAQNPNEPNRFGWVVEVDPMDPTSTPVKRTALGRAAHEGAWVGRDARTGARWCTRARTRVSNTSTASSAATDRARRRHGPTANCSTTACCRWRGSTPADAASWLPLVHGQGPLTAANGFADQGEVLIKARQASDLLGATKMDRPEWLAIDKSSGWVYCTLTNNSQRGGNNRPGVDAANPRANNTMGQIIRWKEDGDFDGAAFRWNHLVLAGDPANERAEAGATSRATSMAVPTASVSTGAACCGSRPMPPPARCTRASSATSATTRCWPATRPAARRGVS
jgi:secreted PhoX family phosphatase